MNEFVFVKCIADENRFKALEFLGEDEKCVCEIVEFLDKEQTLVSHHLKALRECGLVQTRRDGKNIMYRVSDPGIIKILDNVKEVSLRLDTSGECETCKK